MSTTLTISAGRLKSLLAPVMPLADTSGDMPLLTAVRLQSHDGYVIATATDRFILGMKRTKADVDGDLDAVLPLSAARSILSIFKVGRLNDPELVLTFTETTVQVTVGGGMEGIVGASMTWNLHAGRYPLVTGIVIPTDAEDAGEAGEAGEERLFNPHFLAKFAHAAERNEPISIRYHKRLLMVRVGEDFVGALMGVRKSSDEVDRDGAALSWASFATWDRETTEAKKAEAAA